MSGHYRTRFAACPSGSETTAAGPQIARDRNNTIDQLKIHQSQVRVLAAESQQKKQAINLLQTEFAMQQKSLEQEKNKQQVLLSQISGQITQQQREINKLQGDEKRLTELIHELNKLLVEKKSKHMPKRFLIS